MKLPHVKLYGTPEYDWPTIEEGVIIGEGTRIGQNTYVGMNARIGENCRIMQHVTICKDAIIGDRVFVGPNASFSNDKYPPTTISQPPIIEDECTICMGAKVGPGVIMHKRSVAGMGANVTKDIPEGEVWIGNPAKFHMTREEYDRRQNELVERLG